MGRIAVYNLESSRPYAHVRNEDAGPHIFLGVNEISGKRLNPFFGVDKDLARAEAVPIEAHDILELTLALFSNELSTLKEANFNSVAVACLTSNMYVPEKLKHVHPKILGELKERLGGGDRARSYIEHHNSATIQKGLQVSSEIMLNNRKLYETPSGNHHGNPLILFAAMYSMMGHGRDSARDFRVTEHGQIKLANS